MDEYEDTNYRDYRPGKRHLLFTYGTMKRGFRNHARLSKSQFVSDTITMDGDFLMGVKLAGPAPKYKAPIVKRSTMGYHVQGEVYEITGQDLFHIDMAEGHPDAYRRVQVGVIGIVGPVWMYVVDTPKYDSFTSAGIILEDEVLSFVSKEA